MKINTTSVMLQKDAEEIQRCQQDKDVEWCTKMGDSDSGVRVMPGVDSIFSKFGVAVRTGVKQNPKLANGAV